MLAVSQNFKDATESETRNIKARITMKGVTYTNSDIFNVEYNGGSITGETFNIGSTFSNNIKVTFSSIIEELLLDDQVKLEFGVVLSDSTIEYVKMGTFFVTSYDPQRNDFKTVIEASDKMIQLNGTYESELSYPSTIKKVAMEIANKAGILVNETSFSRLSDMPINEPSGYTYRQAIGLIAQFECGFALIDRNGLLDIRMLIDPEYTVNPNSYFSKGLTKDETNYQIGGINCKVVTQDGDSSETTTLQSGSTSGAQISLENNVMTQTLLDGMYQKIRTVNYFPFTLNWRGNPALEAGDWITVVDIRGNRFKVPNLNYKLSFSGGLKAVSSANTQTVSASSYQYKGNLQQQLIELNGRIGAAGNHVYDGLEEPVKPKEKDLWFKPNGPDTEIRIYQDGEWVFQVSTATNPEINQAIEQAKTDAEDAKTSAQDAVDKANASVVAVQANTQLINDVNTIANNAKNQAQTADTNAQTALTNANVAKTTAQTALDKANGVSSKVTTIETNIDTINGTLSSKANTTDVDALKGRVSTAETNITQNATDIKTKVSTTDYNKLDGRVSQAESSITQNANAITQKVSKTDFDTLNGTVTNQATQINQNKTDIATKANQTTVNTLTGRVSQAESSITQNANAVNTKVSQIDVENILTGKAYATKSELTQTSNSLTSTISGVQSNVDALGTNTAYAYSADGTDGFTTVYPNSNLGDNTKTFVGTEVGESNLRGSIRIEPATQKTQNGDFYYLTAKPTRDDYDWFRFFLIPDTPTPNMTKVAVKPNTKYTFSVWLKGTGTHTIYAWQNWTTPNTPWYLSINLTSDWKLYTFTVTSSNIIPSKNVQFFIRSNNGTEINLKYPKVEEGSVATPYMPSSSEVTTADYPKYIGRSLKYSTNPSDYKWEINSGYTDAKADVQQTQVTQLSQDLNGFKTTVSSTYLTTTNASNTYPTKDAVSGTYLKKTDASNTYPTKNTVTSQINQSATDITSSVQSWTNNKLTAYSTTQQTANSITNAVASKADKSQVTQLSDQITSTVNGLASTNLLSNSEFLTKDGWNALGVYDYFSIGTNQYDNYNGSNTLRIARNSNSSSAWWGVDSDKIRVYPGQKLSIGAAIFVTGVAGIESGRVTVSINYYKDSSSSAFSAVGLEVDVSKIRQKIYYLLENKIVPEEAQYALIHIGFNGTGNYLIGQPKFVIGEKIGVYTPAKPASQSQITQLATDINLRVSKGDVTSQINIEAGRTLIDTKQLLLNADNVKFSGSAFIPNSVIQNLSADKITAGTLNAANVNVINLNAANITTGTLTGANLSMNLNTGEVLFQKGIIKKTNGSFVIDITNGEISSDDLNGGFSLKSGALKLRRKADNAEYGSINYGLDNNGEFNLGLTIVGNEGYMFKTQNYTSSFAGTRAIIGSGIKSNITSNLIKICLESQNGISLYGGKTFDSSTTCIVPYFSVGEISSDITGTAQNIKFYSRGSSSTMTSVQMSPEQIEIGAKTTYIWGNFNAVGSKNAIHVTRDGVRATPAYELAESYLGDIGGNYTRENCEVWVNIDELFSDTVNTDIAYHVFLQSYDDAHFWVEDFKSDKFLVKSNKPMSRFAWEIKAKRRGYENERLVIQEGVDNDLLNKEHDEGAF